MQMMQTFKTVDSTVLCCVASDSLTPATVTLSWYIVGFHHGASTTNHYSVVWEHPSNSYFYICTIELTLTTNKTEMHWDKWEVKKTFETCKFFRLFSTALIANNLAENPAVPSGKKLFHVVTKCIAFKHSFIGLDFLLKITLFRLKLKRVRWNVS